MHQVLRVVGFLVSAFSFCSYVSGYMQQTELGTHQLISASFTLALNADWPWDIK